MSKRRGVTLVELTFATGLTVTVLLGAVSVFLFGAATWFRGQGQIDADQKSQKAVRLICDEVREALAVTVDTDGKGLSYTRPQLADGSTSYAQPLTSDGVPRRIFVDASGNVVMTAADNRRIIGTNVIPADPLMLGGSTPYRPFTAGTGTVTRSLSVMLATQTNDFKTETNWSRSRETVYLRNVPVVTQ